MNQQQELEIKLAVDKAKKSNKFIGATKFFYYMTLGRITHPKESEILRLLWRH